MPPDPMSTRSMSTRSYRLAPLAAAVLSVALAAAAHAFIGSNYLGNDSNECGFTCAIWPKQSYNFSFIKICRKIIECIV